jgi:acetyl-CoA acetyltransferase
MSKGLFQPIVVGVPPQSMGIVPPPAAGVRLRSPVARQQQGIGARWGLASACIGSGQGGALLIDDPQAP